jgi:alpha/beta superfamily hydrolase
MRRIESYSIPSPAGQLEALLEEPEGGAPSEACLVCHPHPLGGGTMHNKVVYRMARAFRHQGAVALRFNFRGVGLSEGTFDNGIGELEDARSALGWLRERYPQLRYSLAGFSFGSRIAILLGCGSAVSPTRIVAAGLPRGYHAELAGVLAHCDVPKLFIHSTHDQYGPMEAMEKFLAGVAPPKRLIRVEAKDHFFEGALQDLEDACRMRPD